MLNYPQDPAMNPANNFGQQAGENGLFAPQSIIPMVIETSPRAIPEGWRPELGVQRWLRRHLLCADARSPLRPPGFRNRLFSPGAIGRPGRFSCHPR